MTPENSGMSKIEALRNLEDCYNRLAGLIGDKNADPQLITDLTDEAERIIELINNSGKPSVEGKNEEELQLLESLKRKTEELDELFRKEMGKVKKSLGGLKQGRKVVSAYGPPAVGMGYSEGKFVDKKE